MFVVLGRKGKHMARTVGIGHQDFEKLRMKNNFYKHIVKLVSDIQL